MFAFSMSKQYLSVHFESSVSDAILRKSPGYTSVMSDKLVDEFASFEIDSPSLKTVILKMP